MEANKGQFIASSRMENDHHPIQDQKLHPIKNATVSAREAMNCQWARTINKGNDASYGNQSKSYKRGDCVVEVLDLPSIRSSKKKKKIMQDEEKILIIITTMMRRRNDRDDDDAEIIVLHYCALGF